MSSRTHTFWIFGLGCCVGLLVACGINSQPVPPGFDDSTGGREGDASTNNPTTAEDGGNGTGAAGDADAETGDASDLDAGDGGDASDDGGDAGDGG